MYNLNVWTHNDAGIQQSSTLFSDGLEIQRYVGADYY